jgi:hypothetical protein
MDLDPASCQRIMMTEIPVRSTTNIPTSFSAAESGLEFFHDAECGTVTAGEDVV